MVFWPGLKVAQVQSKSRKLVDDLQHRCVGEKVLATMDSMPLHIILLIESKT